MKGGRRPLLAAFALAGGVAAVSVAVALLTRPPAPHPQPPPPPSPPPRDGGTMAYDAATRSLLLYGGLTFSGSAQTALGDTWSWDGSRWTELHPRTSPPPLTAALMAYDPAHRVVVLTGGERAPASGTEVSPNRTTWTWNGSDWTRVPSAPTPASAGPAAVAGDDATGQLILVTTAAGCGGTGTWLWRGDAWAELHPAVSPGPGHIDGLALDTESGELLLLMSAPVCAGGAGGPSAWTWDGATWKEVPGAPPPTSGALLASFTAPLLVGPETTYAWTGGGTGGTGAWIPIGASPGLVDAAGAYDRANREVVLFSGACASCAAGGLSDDTWTYPARPGHLAVGLWSLQQGPSPPSTPAAAVSAPASRS